jgi:L-serine dehydratase
MRVSRKSRGAEALMIIEVDEPISDDVLEETRQVRGVTNSFRIPPI